MFLKCVHFITLLLFRNSLMQVMQYHVLLQPKINAVKCCKNVVCLLGTDYLSACHIGALGSFQRRDFCRQAVS